MRRVFGWGLFLLLVFFAFRNVQAGTFYPFQGWRTIDTPHFSIHYYHSIEEVAKKSAGYFEEAYQNLTPLYDWRPWGKTQVILTDNNDEANGLTTTIPYNWILLRIVPPDPEGSLGLYDDWLKLLITHEYTHVLHLDANRGFWKAFHFIFGKLISPAVLTPGWVREGTATLEETDGTEGGRGRASFSEMLIRTSVLNKKFITIDWADGIHWKWPGYHTQYIWGVKFLQYLSERFGKDKLMAFHKKTQSAMIAGAINSDAKKVFGKKFYALWEEWKKDLEQKYTDLEEKLRQEGLTPTEPFLGGKDSFYLPTFSKDGKKLAFVRLNPHKAPGLMVKDLETGKETKLAEQTPTQISFSPDGKSIVYSAMATHKRYNSYYDLFEIDLASKNSHRLTHGERARDPDFSPDGKKILFIGGGGGTDVLKLYDITTKEITVLVGEVAPFIQFEAPRYSPDGSKFVVARFENKVGWEIYVYGADGSVKKRLTHNGLHIDSRPVWTPDGKFVLFSSDEDGINNLYAADWNSGTKHRLTRVTTGVFQPAISPDGKTLLTRYYNGDGYDIRKVPFQLEPTAEKQATVTHDAPRDIHDDYNPTKYNPFGKSLFLPRYILPGFVTLDNGFLLTAATGGNDPLRYHNWVVGGSYHTDANHVGYFGHYTYNRWLPVFGVGVDDYAVDFGTLRFTTGNNYHFYEERRDLSGFFSIPIGTRQAFGAGYFYEKRLPITGLLPSEAAALNLGKFVGFNVAYVYGQRQAYPASISPVEEGRVLRLNGTITDAKLGSNEKNEQRIFSGDYREYIPLGKNHVIALRAAGGIALGDHIIPGTFALGGTLGEGALTGGSSRSFSLRGLPVSTFVRDRIMLMSTEYRLPLAFPQRGLGTMPFFINNIHLGLFADYGDAWDSRDVTKKDNFRNFFDQFLLGVGLELRADLVIGHGLPITGRLGYARIVVNRDRLDSLRDPLLNNLVKNGVLIMQWGSSF